MMPESSLGTWGLSWQTKWFGQVLILPEEANANSRRRTQRVTLKSIYVGYANLTNLSTKAVDAVSRHRGRSQFSEGRIPWKTPAQLLIPMTWNMTAKRATARHIYKTWFSPGLGRLLQVRFRVVLSCSVLRPLLIFAGEGWGQTSSPHWVAIWPIGNDCPNPLWRHWKRAMRHTGWTFFQFYRTGSFENIGLQCWLTNWYSACDRKPRYGPMISRFRAGATLPAILMRIHHSLCATLFNNCDSSFGGFSAKKFRLSKDHRSSVACVVASAPPPTLQPQSWPRPDRNIWNI